MEWSLDINSFKVECIKRCAVFDVDPRTVRFYSQQDEDKYIIQYLLKNKIDDGTYLEVGANDGLTYSNTKTLEDFFNFSGILIEPQEKLFNNIKNYRSTTKNELYNCAVTNIDSPTISFMGDNCEGGVTESLNTDISKFGWTKSYQVSNRKMKDILDNSKFEYIDFMFIDVEGSELLLLESIDFKFPIFCIIIEAHSTEQEKNKLFGELLKKNGFTYRERQRGNEVWINHNYFRKHLFHVSNA